EILVANGGEEHVHGALVGDLFQDARNLAADARGVLVVEHDVGQGAGDLRAEGGEGVDGVAAEARIGERVDEREEVGAVLEDTGGADGGGDDLRVWILKEAVQDLDALIAADADGGGGEGAATRIGGML